MRKYLYEHESIILEISFIHWLKTASGEGVITVNEDKKFKSLGDLKSVLEILTTYLEIIEAAVCEYNTS